MFENMTEQQAREQILGIVDNYCRKYHNQEKTFKKGDRIPYASRVYDSKEMVNLVDSALEFWLTAGRYADEFEKNSQNTWESVSVLWLIPDLQPIFLLLWR